MTVTTTAPTGHVITIPALLVPYMVDDWNMDTITYVTDDGRISNLHLSGYTYDNDQQINTVSWNTGRLGFRDITEDIHEEQNLRVWVPEIPEPLAAELA